MVDRHSRSYKKERVVDGIAENILSNQDIFRIYYRRDVWSGSTEDDSAEAGNTGEKVEAAYNEANNQLQNEHLENGSRQY